MGVPAPEDGTGIGHRWAIRVAGGASAGSIATRIAKLFKPGLGPNVTYLEIRNLDTGEIGSFLLPSLDWGIGVGLGFSVGNGEWSHFETEHGESLRSFVGIAGVTSAQVGPFSPVARIVLPVDIKQDSMWSDVWNGNGVDISGTADSVGLGVSEGVGGLALLTITEGPPERPGQSFGDVAKAVMDKAYEEWATSYPQSPASNGDSIADAAQAAASAQAPTPAYDPGVAPAQDSTPAYNPNEEPAQNSNPGQSRR